MGKAKIIISWILVLIYLGVTLTFISAKQKEVKCEKISVNVKDGRQNLFIGEKDVLSILKKKNEKIIGEPVESINVDRLESYIKTHPSVKKANVYRDLNGQIRVSIVQRNPILRVFNNRGESFYIDEEGNAMPLSYKYTAHVLVASGNIKLSYGHLVELQRAAAKQISSGGKVVQNSIPQLDDLFQLATYIYHDEFWNAQIEQIYIRGNEIQMIPRVGSHLIRLGTMENYTKKFRNLKALYEQGLPVTGWNNYQTINLKYSNQVICTKR
jgi:cell division protein FtsQ